MMFGGATSWMSKLQATVALSSTNTEYIAIAHASQEVIWLLKLLLEIGCLPKDIKAQIPLSKTPVITLTLNTSQ